MSSTTKVAKWGNSTAIRVPADLLAQAQLAVGDDVEIRLTQGVLTIAPTRPPTRLQEAAELLRNAGYTIIEPGTDTTHG